MKRKNVTLATVAEKAGVSVSAVSKALNGSSEITENTRERILAIAKELDYRPNFSARSLRLGRSNLIGVIIPNNTYSYNQLLAGIENELNNMNFSAITMTTRDDPSYEKTVINKLLSIPVDAILAIPQVLKNYSHIPIPVVYMSRYPYRNYKTGAPVQTQDYYVITDDYSGQKLATEKILSLCGNNHFLFLGEKNPKTVGGIKEHIRLCGYKEALEEAGLTYEESRVIWNITSLKAAHEATIAICNHTTVPYGIMAPNDYFAIGVMNAIEECNLSIPDQVKLIGFDDFELAEYLFPSLSTIHCSRFTLGTIATQHILSILKNKNPEQVVQTVFQPRFIQRSTT